jgi:integrase
VAAGLLDLNPAEGTGKVLVGHDDHQRRRAFQDDELRALFQVLDPELDRLTRVAVHSGLRAAELLGLRGRHTREGLIVVEQSKTAAGRRIIPAHSAIAGLLEAKADAPVFGWPTAGALSKAFSRAVRRANLPAGLVLHSTRHSFGQRLRDAGVAPDLIAALLGHRLPGVTLQVYAREAPLALMRAAVEAVQYDI